MPEQYKRFGIKVSKIDGISLGACLSISLNGKYVLDGCGLKNRLINSWKQI